MLICTTKTATRRKYNKKSKQKRYQTKATLNETIIAKSIRNGEKLNTIKATTIIKMKTTAKTNITNTNIANTMRIITTSQANQHIPHTHTRQKTTTIPKRRSMRV